MNMADLIDREAAIKALSHGEGCGNICSRAIRRIPAVDAVPVRRGRWERQELAPSSCLFCSECGFPKKRGAWNFCPNCGADMRKVARDD